MIYCSVERVTSKDKSFNMGHVIVQLVFHLNTQSLKGDYVFSSQNIGKLLFQSKKPSSLNLLTLQRSIKRQWLEAAPVQSKSPPGCLLLLTAILEESSLTCKKPVYLRS